MSQLLNRLTPNHFAAGWPVYWRIYLPFWVHLASMLCSILTSFYLDDLKIVQKVSTWIPKIVEWPFLINLSIGLLIYVGLFPLVRLVNKKLSKKFECDLYRNQFSIFTNLFRLNRVIIIFVTVFIIFLYNHGTNFPDRAQLLWIILFLSTLLLVGVVSISIALYGWMSNQFKGEERTLSP